jgi:DUF3016 family protein
MGAGAMERNDAYGTIIVLAALATLWSAEAAAAVRVNFVNPGKYIDANLRHEHGKNANAPTMRELETYFAKLGGMYLAPGEILTIDVLDIDLAGRFEPWQLDFQDVRFMRDIAWPAIKLRYRFESPSRAAIEGEETVSDRSYLTSQPFADATDTMPYEKIMLQRWFRTKFAAKPASTR